MSLHVELLRSDLAEVICTPSLLRRILFHKQETVRFAVRVLVITGGFGWSWDDTQKSVEPNVLAAIERAVREARRPNTFRTASEPPG